jgi:hypothetical protein
MLTLQTARTAAVLASLLTLAAAGPLDVTATDRHASAPAQRTITVSGRIMYQDRNLDRAHPAAGVKVEIWDKDSRGFGTGDLLDTTVTNSEGRFRSQEVPNVDDDNGHPDAGQDIYLRVYTLTDDVRLYKSGTTNQPFDWPSLDQPGGLGYPLQRDVRDGEVRLQDMTAMASLKDVPALWSYVSMAQAINYFRSKTSGTPGPLKAFWASTSTDGPRYDPVSDTIYLRDGDASYEALVLQLAGLAVLDNLYGNLPAACGNAAEAELLVPGQADCAWYQGFATAFALAVRGDPSLTQPEPPRFSSPDVSVDIDLAAAGSPGWQDGDLVPGRVAGAIWDLHEGDQTEEFYDKFNSTMADIWALIANARPTTMREFWQGWVRSGYDACQAAASLYQNTIDYNNPPAWTQLPELTLEEDDIMIVKLWQYISDVECADAMLSFEMQNRGDVNAGVAVETSDTGEPELVVQPVDNWFGQTDITLVGSDGAARVPLNLHVKVISVNDIPMIDPPVSDVEQESGKPITLQLLEHGRDVEDARIQLAWYAEVPEGDRDKLSVAGAGTHTLTFTTDASVVYDYGVRVLLKVRDTQGGEGTQAIALRWSARPNTPPIINSRLPREYEAPVNEPIAIDLEGMGSDLEDQATRLRWYAEHVTHAQVIGNGTQLLTFEPETDFIGDVPITLKLVDTGGLFATTGITLTWEPGVRNQPPQIRPGRILPAVSGMNRAIVYDFRDAAFDPDHPVESLRWYAVNYDAVIIRAVGQGSPTQRMTLHPRPGYTGCLNITFVVRDPAGGEASQETRVCWRQIEIYMPALAKRHQTKPPSR